MFEHMNVKGGNGRQILSAIRNSDAIIVLLDLSKDPVAQMKLIVEELESANIRLNMTKLPAIITKTGQGGIVVIFQGQRIESDRIDIINLLKERKIHNAVVKITDNCTNEDILDALNSNIANKKAIIVANKGEIEGSKKQFRLVTKNYAQNFPILAVSMMKKIGLLSLKSEIFKQLEVIRVYTKEPGKVSSPKPIILPRDSVVEDAAKRLHNKFLKTFKYAKISQKHPRNIKQLIKKQVGINYILQDGDIIQFYT
jgi:ribosome-interacting GTPase 1